jgi:hypothetical protein
MPTLATSAAVTSTCGVSRSTISLGKSSTSALASNFISTVISARPWASIGSAASGSTGKIISKKLWRPRSKGRGSTAPAWTPQVGTYLFFILSFSEESMASEISPLILDLILHTNNSLSNIIESKKKLRSLQTLCQQRSKNEIW